MVPVTLHFRSKREKEGLTNESYRYCKFCSFWLAPPRRRKLYVAAATCTLPTMETYLAVQ